MSNRMLVLVGLPGSGKSTLSNKLISYKKKWERVNQDEMKSRKACEMHVKKFLDKGLSVVVDRCNFDRDQRRTWVEIAQHYKVPIDCVVLTTTEEECGDRISVRTNHATGVSGDKGLQVLRRFIKTYRPPRLDSNEGFSRVLYLDPSPEPECSEERIDEMFDLLNQCPLLVPEFNNENRDYEKPKIIVDSDGWSTIPTKQHNQ